MFSATGKHRRFSTTRAVEGMWREMGGKLAGSVREGRVPSPQGIALKPAFEVASLGFEGE